MDWVLSSDNLKSYMFLADQDVVVSMRAVDCPLCQNVRIDNCVYFFQILVEKPEWNAT
jgi:hypothetical protein